jgi:hypothetical protein
VSIAIDNSERSADGTSAVPGCTVSVVMPCLNEAEAIGRCIAEAQRQFRLAGIDGEVVVCDNGSDDGSDVEACRAGARVVHEPRKGYGSALSTGIRIASATYIVIVDADWSYDLSALPRIVSALDSGADLVMGNRFKGRIARGAMPWMHRCIGGPALSALLNLFFGTQVGDVNCGLRAFTREAYEILAPRATGMEFASEMVARAGRAGVHIAEVPVDYRNRLGRSKLRRYRDGWRHLRFLLMFSPTWLYLVPSGVLAACGLILLAALAISPLELLGRRWDMHLAATASLVTVLGTQLGWLGISARTVAILHGFGPQNAQLGPTRLNLESGLALAGVFTLVGVVIASWVVLGWIIRGLPPLDEIRPLLLAITLIVVGVQGVFNAFFLSLLRAAVANQ